MRFLYAEAIIWSYYFNSSQWVVQLIAKYKVNNCLPIAAASAQNQSSWAEVKRMGWRDKWQDVSQCWREGVQDSNKISMFSHTE